MPNKTRSKHRPSGFRAIIAGLASALFFVLAFPPFSLWGAAFLIPFPLFLLARSTKSSNKLSPKRAAMLAGIGCMPGWVFTQLWVSEISVAGLVPLVLFLSSFTTLFVWTAIHLLRRFNRELIVLPIVWVGVEFFRGSVFGGGYPWYLLAHPLIDSPKGMLASPASIGGVYFVSFLVACYGVVFMHAITQPTKQLRQRSGLIAGGFFTAWVGIGYLLIPSAPDNPTTVRIGVIQPDVPQDNRSDWTVRQRLRDWYTLRDITLAAASDPTNPGTLDLIVWPEGFVPGWTFDPMSLLTEQREELAWNLTPNSPDDVPELTDLPDRVPATMVVEDLHNLQRSLDIPMVVGSVAYDNLQIVETDDVFEYQRDAMYNSAFAIVNGQTQPVWYDKVHLTPFGEVMPYISSWEWLEQSLLAFGAQGMQFALDPGEELRLLTIPIDNANEPTNINLATPICFEATVSSVCRELVFDKGTRRTGIMLNLTNDGWFGDSDAGRTAHMLCARWRSIELNTPMVRSANTGVSCVIDHIGQVQTQRLTPHHTPTQMPNPRQGYLIADVVLGQGATIYAWIGDAFGWACFLTTLVWGITTIFGRSSCVPPPKTE